MSSLNPKTILGREPAYARLATREMTGASGDYVDLHHRAAFSGALTVSMSFSLDRLVGEYALVSKDGSGTAAGDFTLWIKDGAIVLSQDSGSGTKWLRVPEVLLDAHETYHLATSFGQDGMMIWLNGALVAAEPEFKQGLGENKHPLVIGGSRAWRGDDDDEAHSLFKGKIGDVLVYEGQLGAGAVQKLAAAADPSLVQDARFQAKMGDLMPLLEQMHGASDTLLEILEGYGVSEHGHMMRKLAMTSGSDKGQKMAGSGGADGIDGAGGNDLLIGRGGADVLQGGYGNDRLIGGGGNDILAGGHGEDRLKGGGGDDLLVSRADGREGRIYFDPDRDEGDPYRELTNGKLYPDQPIPADDLLIGGKGADIFYFQTLINAKERYIEKHTRDDGTVNWHGVAGENDKLHDHWVDVLGNDVVGDFNRAQGDRIVLEGHTTEILKIRHQDSNGDGILDRSVIELYSEQGNGGGAHADDRLGSITVYGDLVRESDIEHTAKPAYGIVRGIDDLAEALAPAAPGANSGPMKPPKSALNKLRDLDLRDGLKPALAAPGAQHYDPEDRAAMIVEHSDALALGRGTIAFSFRADEVGEFQALFSKDADGSGKGHVVAYVNEVGTLTVRIQDGADSHHLSVDHLVKAGRDYDVALSFGAGGAQLWVNGARVAYDSDLTTSLRGNSEALVIGATGWSSTPGTTDAVHNHFAGEISDFMVFGQALSGNAIFGGGARADTLVLNGSVEDYAFARLKGDLVLSAKGRADVKVADRIEFLKFADMTVRESEVVFGSRRDDRIDGRDGADILLGGAGADDLRGNDNDDLLRGGIGADSLSGGDGDDLLFGELDDDRLFGHDGADRLEGGDGADMLYGGAGNDRLRGGLGDDRIYGHEWNDAGGAKNDRVFYDGKFRDYDFDTATWTDGNRGGAKVVELRVTDSANGGADGFYEGSDRLIDVDFLVFADRVVAFDDLL